MATRRTSLALYRAFLRDVREIKKSASGGLYIQAPLEVDKYAHLYRYPPVEVRGVEEGAVAEELMRVLPQDCPNFATASYLRGLIRRSFQVPLPPAGASAAAAAGAGGGGEEEEGRGGVGEAALAQLSAGERLDLAFTALRELAEQMDRMKTTSVAETLGIRVIATSRWLITQDAPDSATQAADAGGEDEAPNRKVSFFVYRIRIDNLSKETVQIISRHWQIYPEEGTPEEVPKGSPGIVGEQPLLRPGGAVMYISGAQLPCARGVMTGSFQTMKVEDKREGEKAGVDAAAAAAAAAAGGGGGGDGGGGADAAAGEEEEKDKGKGEHGEKDGGTRLKGGPLCLFDVNVAPFKLLGDPP